MEEREKKTNVSEMENKINELENERKILRKII
jgi:hypothetical protein